MVADLNTYLTKAIPDTRLTIEKYADVKFEYLVRDFFLLIFGINIRIWFSLIVWK